MSIFSNMRQTFLYLNLY